MLGPEKIIGGLGHAGTDKRGNFVVESLKKEIWM
jgi:hypothetical protein